MANGGKRKAAKRAARRAVKLDPSFLLPAAGVTFSVVAWGYLVSAAIDFGAQARNGETAAWVYLGIACLGAAACLFAGLMMGAHVLRALGITRGRDDGTPTGEHSASVPPRETVSARIPGGRRARR